MNIQLRRRRNQSLIQTPETTKHDARPFKVISTPTNFDFQLPPDSKLTVPNADLPSPIQPRKTSTTTRCVDTPLRRPEILTEDIRNRTVMSFALDRGADTGFSREKRRELRPTTATDKGFRDTRSSKAQGEVEKTMEDSFKQYLNNKMIERERQQTASLKVRMKEEEYRDEMRKKYEDEEKRRKMVLNKLFADKKGKIKSSQAERKEIHERQEQQRKDMIIANREKKKNLLAKLEKSEQNKKEADMRKTQKLSEWNSMIYERQQDRLEKRDQKEEMFLSTLSVMWENKFDDPIDRKKRFLEERVYRSQKHSVEVEERYKKAKDESANAQTMYLQKVARKLMKVRSKSVMSKREIGNKEGSESDDEAKGEVIMKKNKQDEREKLKQLKEKEKLISERMKKRELDLQEYVSEKRDEWNLKLNNIRKNLEIASKDTERKIEHQIYSYKDRIESIKTSKLHRKKQLEYIDKAFLHGERSFVV